MKMISLTDLGPDNWFKNKSDSIYWVRIYTSLGIPHKNFINAVKGGIKSIDLGEPVSITYMLGGDLNSPQMHGVMHSNEDGHAQINIETTEKKLPLSTYIILFTLRRRDGIDIPENEAKHRLNIVASIIRAHNGLNFLRDSVFEGMIFADQNTFRNPGLKVTTPKIEDGPFINAENWDHMGEIFNVFPGLEINLREKIELSLDFYTRALNGDEKFFNYWTAMEVICSGSAQAIRDRLKECYGFKSRGDVDRFLGFGTIANWRHYFIHQGIRPKYPDNINRYLQLLYLDLLRHKLGLSHIGYALGMKQRDGCNLIL